MEISDNAKNKAKTKNKTTDKATDKTMAMGYTCFFVGLLCQVFSNSVPGGFGRGLLQGMTVGLMLGSVYLFALAFRTQRARRKAAEAGSEGPGSDGLWLPSEDQK